MGNDKMKEMKDGSKTNNKVNTHMLVHIAWDIGNIEVGVCLVRELLELGVERFLNICQ